MNLGDLEIDFQKYATQAESILGIRGSGKTYTATQIAEQLLDWGCPISVIDPSGTWKNLKIANGENGRAYDIVVFGSENADIIIDENFDKDTIPEIITVALENNVSFIFDLYRSSISKESWGEILTLAFQTIYLKNRNMRKIFIEEAATFIPQNQKAFSKDLYNILEEITRIGGNAQIGIGFVSQRAEQLNKQCLELCDLMILHRQRGNNSLKTIKKWLSMGVVSDEDIERVLESIPTLESGTAWILEQESQTPHKVTIPLKNSIHPDRKRFTESYLFRSKNVDTRKFIEKVKDIAPVQSQVEYSSSEIIRQMMDTLRQTENVEIDLEFTEAEYQIVKQAENAAYGDSTVKNIIDNLILSGYQYNQTFSYLQLGTRIFVLRSEIESSYAQLILRKLQ